MTADQFKRRLRDIQLSQAAFARLVNVHHNTVSRWTSGQAKVPGPVIAYLDLADGVLTLTKALAPKR